MVDNPESSEYQSCLYKEHENGVRPGSSGLKAPHLCVVTLLLLLCHWSPRTSQVPCFTRLSVCTYGSDLQQQKDSTIGTGQRCLGWNEAQALKSSLQVESHRVHLVPLAMSCDSMSKCQPGKPIRNCVRGFCWGQGVLLKIASTWQVPTFQTPRRKAGAHHEAHVCTKS